MKEEYFRASVSRKIFAEVLPTLFILSGIVVVAILTHTQNPSVQTLEMCSIAIGLTMALSVFFLAWSVVFEVCVNYTTQTMKIIRWRTTEVIEYDPETLSINRTKLWIGTRLRVTFKKADSTHVRSIAIYLPRWHPEPTP